VKNILITAAGCPGFYSVQKAIKSIDFLSSGLMIHGCDMNPKSIGLKFCDKYFIAPKGSSEKYVSKLFEYCSGNKIDLIIPCSDEELIPLARSKQIFASIGCNVLACSETSLETILNKQKLFEFLKSGPVKNHIPKSFICNNVNDFKRHYERLKDEGCNVCIKPTIAHGGRGFRVISDVRKEDLFEQKASHGTMSYKSLVEVLSDGGDTFPDLMVMEYMCGTEYSVDCSKNEKFTTVPRTREIIQDGICVAGTTIENEKLIDLSEKIYNLLGIRYHANIQYRYDHTGNPKLLEVNPRFSGTMEHCRGAGVNFAEIAIRESFGLPAVDYSIKWQTRMTRVWQEVFSYEHGSRNSDNENKLYHRSL
tara:strand:- start:5791 stop:6882 length:1092 start_codon:yes stop_codon:yes gene_type:complete